SATSASASNHGRWGAGSQEPLGARSVACDAGRKEVRRSLISTTLADLFTPLCVANPFSAMRAALRGWSSDEFEDGLTHGGQGWGWWRPGDSFFRFALLSRRYWRKAKAIIV